MDILTYTEAHHRFRERLRKFCDTEIVPQVEQWEADHIVPKEIWQKMGRGGFLCPTLPAEYGGIGGDFIHCLIVTEELSRTMQTGLAAGLHSDVVVPYIESFGSDEQKRNYLPGCVSGDCVTAVAMTEPGAGSDVAGMETTAVEDGDAVILNGSKTFISNGVICDLLVIAAKDPAVENKHQAVSLYWWRPAPPDSRRAPNWKKWAGTARIRPNCFSPTAGFPQRNRLGEKGAGFFMLMGKLQQERLVCCMGGVVGAERLLEYTMAYCQNTMVCGKPLSKSQAVQFALVEMATEVKLGRTFMEKLIADHMEGQNVIVETSMAKYWATDLANRTANRVMDIVGEVGALESCPLARGLRDARVMSIFAGTNEIMKGIAAKFMGL